MVEIPSRSVSLWVVLILSRSMGSLLVHFCAESLAPAAQTFAMDT
jgi:hypothetical protein